MEQNMAEPIANETVSTQPENQGLCVKYNGEEHRLSHEEAVTYAQKGMNYDKIYEKLKGLEKTLPPRDGASPNDEDFRRQSGQEESPQELKQLQQDLLIYQQKDAFLKQHPDVGELPPSVLQAAAEWNLPLEQAWRMTAGYESLQKQNSDLTRQLLIATEQLQNQNRSTGSARDLGDTTPLTRSVGRMSMEEYERYRDAIWRDLEKSRRTQK